MDSLEKIIEEMKGRKGHQLILSIDDVLEWASRLEALQGGPVAYRYKDTRGHYRYVGSKPDFIIRDEYKGLSPEPLYAAPQQADGVLERLRGQLQNCVNLLHRMKRHGSASDDRVADEAIESANKALYETLIKVKP